MNACNVTPVLISSQKGSAEAHVVSGGRGAHCQQYLTEGQLSLAGCVV
jgi:hypothetical protein